MTGLLGIRTAIPQVVLFAITIPITAIYQILLQWKIEKKLEFLDVTEEYDLESGKDQSAVKGVPAEEKNPTTFVTDSTNGQVPVQRADAAEITDAGEGTDGPHRTGASVAPDGVTAGVEGSAGVDAVTDQLPPTNANAPSRGHAGIDNFYHPAVTAPVPVIWIPEDPLGISKEEIRDTEAAGDIKITDSGAKLDETNKLGWSEDPPDYEP